MTQEQMDKLFELKSLFEEGILTKEELEQEKAKILGIESIKANVPKEESVVVEKIEEKQPEPIIEQKPVEEPQIIAQQNVSVIQEDNIEQKSEVTSSVEQIELQKESIKVDNNSFKAQNSGKLKMPLLIILGLCLVLGIVFAVIPKKSSNNYSQKESINQYDNSIYNEELDTDVDMFEELWKVGSSRRLSSSDLSVLSKSELRILRNYFYAKLNYKFKNDDLRNHFSQYPWYRPINSNVDNKLTKIQTANIQFIKSLE